MYLAADHSVNAKNINYDMQVARSGATYGRLVEEKDIPPYLQCSISAWMRASGISSSGSENRPILEELLDEVTLD